VKKKKISENSLPNERPGESLWEKESRKAEAILARQRAARVIKNPKKPTK
jgi:hypothetical protein